VSPESQRRATLGGLRLAILGCGAVGRTFAVELARAGSSVLAWSRDSTRAEAAARLVREAGGEGQAVDLSQVPAADGILLCVHDEALEELAARLAELSQRVAVAWHTCGFHGAEVLQSLEKTGTACGKLHPMVALPRGKTRESSLRGAFFSLAGDAPALELARRIVAALGGEELALRDDPGAHRLYHASAALASGGLVALFATAANVLQRAAREGEDRERIDQALLFLLRSTLANLEHEPPTAALTGPTARGAASIVAGHLRALADVDPSAAELYRQLTAHMQRLLGDSRS